MYISITDNFIYILSKILKCNKYCIDVISAQHQKNDKNYSKNKNNELYLTFNKNPNYKHTNI